MIAVPVVDGEQMGGRLVELPGAAGTDKAVQPERFLPVVAAVIQRPAHLPDPGISLFQAWQFY